MLIVFYVQYFFVSFAAFHIRSIGLSVPPFFVRLHLGTYPEPFQEKGERRKETLWRFFRHERST